MTDAHWGATRDPISTLMGDLLADIERLRIAVSEQSPPGIRTHLQAVSHCGERLADALDRERGQG